MTGFMPGEDWMGTLKVSFEELVPRKCCLPQETVLLWVWVWDLPASPWMRFGGVCRTAGSSQSGAGVRASLAQGLRW